VKKRKSYVAIMFVLISCLLLLSITINAAPKARTIRVAWGETVDPWSHPQSAYFNVLKYHIESLSNGEMKVELHPAASLGTAPQVLDLLVKNTVQICGSLPLGVVSSKYAPLLNVLNTPYLFRSTGVKLAVMADPEIKGYLNRSLVKACGIRFLSTGCEGERFFTTNSKLIKTPNDLKGLKMRVMEGKIYAETMKALGANPIPVPWAELYTALQTKMVDGQENPPLNIKYKALHECQKYMSGPGPFSVVAGMFINDKFYSSLSGKEKKIIDVASIYASQAHRGMVELKNLEALNFLSKKMTLYIQSEKEFNMFRDKCQPKVKKYIRSQLNKAEKVFYDKLLAKVKKIERQF
jgi:TRAP-type C4-dicarboxylate transport system substrate-binding protein